VERARIFIEFGGLVCRPQRPLCPGCVLGDICQYAKTGAG